MPAYPDLTPSWLKPENASVTDSTMTKVLRALAGMIGADDPASQVMGLATTGVPVKKGIRAFHGSPHDFDKFSMEKIGTGEGAQAYGHGLYFADSEDTARYYRDSIMDSRGPRPVKYAGQDFVAGDLRRRTLEEIDKLGKEAALANLEKSIRFNDGYAPDQANLQRIILEWARGIDPSQLDVPKGSMYEVNIKADPDTMLDWDLPLSQQSERVQQALRRAGVEYGDMPGQPPTNDPDWGDIGKEAIPPYRYDPTGGELVAGARPFMGTHVSGGAHMKNAEQRLRSAGVPGIKYLDQGSRAAGAGSRNYVVFDDSLIDIVRKFGLALPLAGAGLAQPLDVGDMTGREQ